MEAQALLLRMREVATRLHVSEQMVSKMIADGRLHAVRIGRAVRVPVAEVERVAREGTK
jgi:excisionase family DNA binding protein